MLILTFVVLAMTWPEVSGDEAPVTKDGRRRPSISTRAEIIDAST